MTNIKATKRALGSSVLALFLCFAMLLGTTFAWFTDSVTSANNIITAGNLDVKLEYWNGEKWTDVEGASDILTNTLWEPGVTEVAYLRVANAGSLALKYQLGINIVSEKAGTNKAGKSFLLSDYIQFGVVEGVNGETNAYANRNAAVEAVKEAKKISAGYTKKNTLYSATNIPADIVGATSEEYIALVVYMPETVGDEANHNGDAPTINLGINVVATQVTGENDSYGPDYDANAPICNVIVESEEALKEALANAKNGDVIGISGNVTWTTGAGSGSTPFVEPVATVDDDAKDPLTYITLVGVGEDATFTAIGAGVGAIGIDNGTVIFKNLKIVDESVSYKENSWEFGYLEFRGNTVFEDCEIVNAIMMEGDSATFKNCSFNSNKESEYAVWVSDGEVSFENCYFTGTRGIKVHEAYGSNVDNVVINNNRFIGLSEKPGLAIGDVDPSTIITVTNNEFIGTQEGDQKLYSYETDTDTKAFNFVYESNKVDKETKVASSVEELKSIANKDAIGAKVLLTSGTYNMGGTFGLAEGVELIGDGDVIINGTLSGTLNNTTIKNVHIKSGNAQRWAYSKGNLVFENCTFESTSVYAIHYDGLNGANITYKDCTIIGWAAIGGGAAHVTFDGCEIYGNGAYGLIRLYSPGTIKDCTFDVEKVNTTDVYQDGIHAVDCTVDVINCKNVNGHVTDLFNTSGTGVITVDGAVAVETAGNLDNALNNGGNAVLTDDLTFSASDTTANSGYGATGVKVNGGVLDGNGNTLTVNNANDTWDCAVNINGGTVKNVNVEGAFRGIFMGAATGDVYIDNVVIDKVCYAFNSDGGSKEYGVYISNSTLNGWTSYSDVHKEVIFTNCKFGKGTGGYKYAYCRPYNATEFVDCDFEVGFEIEPLAAVTFENCTIGGVALTAENLSTLVTDTAKATIK